MTVNKPSHWILDNISNEDYAKAFEIVDTRLVAFSLDRTMTLNVAASNEENEFIKSIADFIELAVIDLMAKKEELNEAEKSQVCEMYQHLFHLLRVLPIPTKEIEKIKYVYRLVAFSYLGQKWESGRRYIKENKDDIVVNIAHADTWDIRMFKQTYSAFVHLVRKNSWDDLSSACSIITELRKEQKAFEKSYIDNLDQDNKLGGAYELIGLYHYAKAIDIVTTYMLNGSGSLSGTRDQVNFHFDKAVEASEKCSNIEMSLLMQLLKNTLTQMLSNSVWCVTERINSRVTKFVNAITRSPKPVFELLYPQRAAVLEQGLLNPAHKAVVVDMPTSSGKTLIAEFRILQALNQFAEDGGWVAYVAPTRALVNQVTARLRKDFTPIGIKVEKMSGAIEIDSFEETIILDKTNKFDLLVTTPEKLNLLIRDGIEEKIQRKLVLAVIDEAHNISDKTRGLALELLMANIKNDCDKANFLLLTPFVPNRNDIARWLDQDSPKSISISLTWKPNDRVIGAIYPEGSGRSWNAVFETLLTSNERIQLEKKIAISKEAPLDITRSSLTKGLICVATAKIFSDRRGILLVCQSPTDCWTVADKLFDETVDNPTDEDVDLVKNYIASELGSDFKLIRLLDRGIGVHHSGLPDDIRYLMEWLMEKEKLRCLVATTTIAQGINFPVSAVLMTSYNQRNKGYTEKMSTRDFWNLVGRSGRTEQSSLGIVGVVVGAKENIKGKELSALKQYVKENTEELVSNLVEMIESAVQFGRELDLSGLSYKPEWSQFLQYITHMFNQCSEMGEFNTKAELFLRRTYGYSHCSREKQVVVLEAVKKYGQKLNENKGLAKLSDSTGFSFETIKATIGKANSLGINNAVWNGSKLFSANSSLKDLMGIMLSIPEIRNNLEDIGPGGRVVTGDTLANITVDWVSGHDIESIATKYFGGNSEKALTDCCRAIFSKLLNTATWGLASLQKVPSIGADFDKLPPEEQLRLKNLPAMIYYGVNTDEAILMRINNVPRSIAASLGNKLKAASNNIYKVSPSQAQKWLNELPESEWNSAVVTQKAVNGGDYKRIWKILNGEA
ncbi:MAG: DEAD/DEAH box helicase [Clostridia bacterium]|nr:DEAD/DEAH box helicase [Clostridia bacterium]